MRDIKRPALDGFGDGYGIGLAGHHERPHLTMKDAWGWLKRYPMATRRRFVRGFAVGAARFLTLIQDEAMRATDD